MTPSINTTSEPAVSAQEDSPDGEGDPSRTWADISVNDDRWDAVPGLIAVIPRIAAEALRAAQLSPETHSVSVALLSDTEVHALNKAFRGKDAPTNVLSFPSTTPSLVSPMGEPLFLGDVALAYETVVSEAGEQGKSVLHHAAHLVAHGVLHLAGFDHEADVEAERMEETERAILAVFAIPDPYGQNAIQAADAR